MPSPETTWRRRGVPPTVSNERLIELYSDGWTLTRIAHEVGLSRQRVSQRLIEAGLSPAARRAAALAGEDDFRRRRAETARVKAQQREDACQRLSDLAAKHGVTPWTLSRYALRSGKVRQGPLPDRATAEGQVIAKRVREACEPLTPGLVGNLCSRRASLHR
jgi:AraC-like DNA-binding protein